MADDLEGKVNCRHCGPVLPVVSENSVSGFRCSICLRMTESATQSEKAKPVSSGAPARPAPRPVPTAPKARAIETQYKGYRFRSRLEARWAVYFDTMGIEWDYEKEGYDLDGIWYLPDFWLKPFKMWLEVKPEKFNADEFEKCHRLVLATGHECIMAPDLPRLKTYSAIALPTGRSLGRGHSCRVDHDIVSVLIAKHRPNNLFDARDEEWRTIGFQINEDIADTIYRSMEAARGARFEHGERR
jgi:hypothetical protein